MTMTVTHGAMLAAATIAALATSAAAETVVRRGDSTVVNAPTTRVETNSGRSSVRVDAPRTRVDVDTRERSVRLRVPYYNRDIRW